MPSSIDERQVIVGTRERIGNWEQGTGGGLVTLAKRGSRLYLVQRVDSKNAEVVSHVIIDILTPYKDNVYTITFDNGGGIC